MVTRFKHLTHRSFSLGQMTGLMKCMQASVDKLGVHFLFLFSFGTIDDKPGVNFLFFVLLGRVHEMHASTPWTNLVSISCFLSPLGKPPRTTPEPICFSHSPISFSRSRGGVSFRFWVGQQLWSYPRPYNLPPLRAPTAAKDAINHIDRQINGVMPSSWMFLSITTYGLIINIDVRIHPNEQTKCDIRRFFESLIKAIPSIRD